MARLAAALFFIYSLSACGPLIDVKIIRNPNPKEAPAQKPGEEAPRTLLDKSREETEAGTKSFVINVLIDSAFASAVGLGSAACVQVVELSDGEVVVDFGNVACPAPSTLLAKDNLVFTLRYLEPESGFVFNIVLNDEENVLGNAEANPIDKTVTLTSLCTGDFVGKCVLTIENQTFKSFEE